MREIQQRVKKNPTAVTATEEVHIRFVNETTIGGVSFLLEMMMRAMMMIVNYLIVL